MLTEFYPLWIVKYHIVYDDQVKFVEIFKKNIYFRYLKVILL